MLASSLALNVPLAQGSHLAGFPFWAATNFLPAAHFVTDTNKTDGTLRWVLDGMGYSVEGLWLKISTIGEERLGVV